MPLGLSGVRQGQLSGIKSFPLLLQTLYIATVVICQPLGDCTGLWPQAVSCFVQWQTVPVVMALVIHFAVKFSASSNSGPCYLLISFNVAFCLT